MKVYTGEVSVPSFGPGLSVESCSIPRQAYRTHLQLFKELYPRLMGITQIVGFQLPAAKSLQSHHQGWVSKRIHFCHKFSSRD